jgi:hypothetical protein
MANNLGVTTGTDANVKTTDTAGVHTPHHNVDTCALPTGAATEATLASALTALGLAATEATLGDVLTALAAATPAGTNLIGKVGIDQTTPGMTNLVAAGLIAGTNEIGRTNIKHIMAAATALTRPANTTAYTALDSVSDNATAGSVTANSVTVSDVDDDPVNISQILLSSTDTGPGTSGALIRLHLFNSDPTTSSGVVGGDNAAWSNKQAGWAGSFTGQMIAFSDGSRGVLSSDGPPVMSVSPVAGGRTFYWQLQTLTAFTPSANSTTFTPKFRGYQGRA